MICPSSFCIPIFTPSHMAILGRGCSSVRTHYLYIMYKANQPSTKTMPVKQTTEQAEKDSAAAFGRHKLSTGKILLLLASRLLINRQAQAFNRVGLLPLRELNIQKRMKRVIENVFKRQDYLSKWEGFQNIRRGSLLSEKKQYEQLKSLLKRQRATSIRLLTNFMMGKKRSTLHSMLARIKERADVRQHQINNNYRKGLRSVVRVFARKMGHSLFRLKDSRVILGQNSQLRGVVRIIKQIRIQNMRWSFVILRREMIRNRQEKAKEEIEELDEKLGKEEEEDEELTGLQNRHKELTDQLEATKKEREDIQAKLEADVKEAEDKKTEMKEHLNHLKTSQEEMRKRIDEIDEELKTPFSQGEIYQLCYENLLWTVSQNKEKTFNRDDLLRSLQIPLVPIDLPLDQLKEENKILKDLLSEYVVMYGEKKLPVGSKLQLPYEYLLKENNLLYKMLMALLPNAQFLREELHTIRETYEGVEKMIKECTHQ